MRTFLFLAFFFLVSSSLTSHIDATPIVGRHDVPDERYLALATEYAESQALFLFNKTDMAGTLISPEWVLSAAHVAKYLKPGDSLISDLRKYEITEIIIHPEYGEDHANDLALVKLGERVEQIRPVPVYQGRNELQAMVVIMGNGDKGTGRIGPIDNDGRLRAVTNTVDEVSNYWLKWDFSDPDSAGATKLEGVSGPGDSSGPAFITEGQTVYLAGISSAQSTRTTAGREGVYGVREYYVRVSSHVNWILETMLAN